MTDAPPADRRHLVLLPGMDGTGELFRAFVSAAPGHVTTQVIAFPPDRKLGYGDLARLTLAQLPRENRFVLLGESFSGPLALGLAARSPPGLMGVVLCASFVRAPVAARRLAWLAGLAGRTNIPAWVLGRVLAGDDAELARDVQSALAGVRSAVLGARARAIARVDAREALRRCPVPVHVLRAGADRLLGPAPSDEISEIRPDAAVHVIDAPHLLLQCAPDAAWEALRTALA